MLIRRGPGSSSMPFNRQSNYSVVYKGTGIHCPVLTY